MSALSRFIGGSPLEVAIKLVLMSFVVGIILSALNIDPLDIIAGIRNVIARIYALGFDSIEWALRYLALGAAVVIPIWLVLRFLKVFGKGD
ncbi:MAG: integrase [Rhizobiales bacterium]|nr:integrase [Hyphomicrobiales bacterium]